jgi:hypothetical protein
MLLAMIRLTSIFFKGRLDDYDFASPPVNVIGSNLASFTRDWQAGWYMINQVGGHSGRRHASQRRQLQQQRRVKLSRGQTM